MTDGASKRGGLRNPPGGRPTKDQDRPNFDTALEYAMAVINDRTVTARRRDAMAMAVLRYGYQAPTSKPDAAKDIGKKATANIAAETAHEETDWKGLVN